MANKILNLALQGGGSHGAFTWGVLDRLLEMGDHLQIEGISGTSAGALNAAVLAQGFAKGGAPVAREALDQFWARIGELGQFGQPQRQVASQLLGVWGDGFDVTQNWLEAWQRIFSPYQTNPFNFNPLRVLVTELLDIDAIRRCDSLKLFISATDVETGRIRVFTRPELTIDALMASACLPFTFQAVQIEGKPYWDGGYVGNPAIFPLIYNCDCPDVMVVQVNPLSRPGTPQTAGEIIGRLNEISFNAALISEMRAIAFVQRLIDEGNLVGRQAERLKRMLIHVVSAEDQMRALGAASKSTIDPDFLNNLKQIGRTAADAWIKANWDKIGIECTVNVKQVFL
jgi:NTE family protein